MSGFVEAVRRLVARAEVDDVDRDTAKIVASRQAEEERGESFAALRASESRHPDLGEAVKRRNAVR